MGKKVQTSTNTSWQPLGIILVIIILVAGLFYHRKQQNSWSTLTQKDQLDSKPVFFIRDFNLWKSTNGNDTQLTDDGSNYRTGSSQPLLSLDGKSLAYIHSDKRGSASLYVTRTDSFQPKLIAEDLGTPATFTWSSNNQSIYYISSRKGASSFSGQVFTDTKTIGSVDVITLNKAEIGSISVSGECGGGTSDPAQLLANVEQIENTAKGMNTFQVSANDSILLHATDCEGEHLATYDIKQKKDLALKSQVMRGTISPDGSRIAAVREGNIVIINAMSGTEEKKFDTVGTPITLMWQADNQKLFYSTNMKTNDPKAAYTVNSSDIYSIDLASGTVKKEIERNAYALRLINTDSSGSTLIFAEIENTSQTLDPKVNVYGLNLSDGSVKLLVANAQEATL